MAISNWLKGILRKNDRLHRDDAEHPGASTSEKSTIVTASIDSNTTHLIKSELPTDQMPASLVEPSTSEPLASITEAIEPKHFKPGCHPAGSDMMERKQENECAVLYWVARFGWLTTPQITALVWRRESAKRMAQITIARLIEQRYLARHMLPNGIPVSVLTRSGAARVRDEIGYSAHATDRQYAQKIWDAHRKGCPSDYYHRALCNWVAIDSILHPDEGYGIVIDAIWTEHEIRQRIGQPPPPPTSGWNKTPDLLILHKDISTNERWLIWVEVETSRRRRGGTPDRDDWRKIGNFVLVNAPNYFQASSHGPYCLGGITFIGVNKRLVQEVANSVHIMGSRVPHHKTAYQEIKREVWQHGGTLYRLASMNGKLAWKGWESDIYGRLGDLFPDTNQGTSE